MLTSICVFCGANQGNQSIYREQAAQLGRQLAENNITLIYGAGNVGLMGIVADSALAAGGKVIGVIPQSLVDMEVAHTGLTQLHVVRSMHERKQLMCDLADAFVALPGGFGTLDELCEILTWNQLGIIQKPTALLNTNGYFNGLIAMLDHAVQEGFLKPRNRELLLVTNELENLLPELTHHRPTLEGKWINPRIIPR